jgi:hypothetical protein
LGCAAVAKPHFLIQLLCAEIVALKNEQVPATRRLATATDVETAVAVALEHGSFFFSHLRTCRWLLLLRQRLIWLYWSGAI